MIGVTLAALAAAAAPLPDAAPEIIVTASDRGQRAIDAPIAVSIVSGETLRNSGAVDIRGLGQLSPSLLVSSSSNEAGGGGARIRGGGTVGDNPGLESSVASYVDGVYRARAAVALTELGPIDHIEVLHGPQGTLFGRNASAGLINIVTAAPSLDPHAYAEASFGNYDARRFAAGLTGALAPDLAARIDGVWFQRDGFVRDVVSGNRLNDRDRMLARGKLRWTPDASFTATLIADYQRRNEDCCGGIYYIARDLKSSTPGVGGGSLIASPSSIAALIRATPSAVSGAQSLVIDNGARAVALTPGQTFQSAVQDGGVSLTLEKHLDSGVTLTSITAWRTNRFTRAQDADFSSLDLLDRPADGNGYVRYRNVSQELRARGHAFGGRLDWLVGGYLGLERLTLADNMAYGADYDAFASARTGLSGGNFATFARYGFAHLNAFANAFGGPALAAQVQDVPITGTGEQDLYHQHDRNIALFTHEIVKLTDRLSLTVGARTTWDRKTLDASLGSTSNCGVYVANIARLRALGTPQALALANSVLAPLAGYPCNINSVAGAYSTAGREHNWSGTAALSYRIAEGMLAYASWSRGYKAGGFNLDRAALFNSAALSQLPFSSLAFKPETVEAIEIGAKAHRGPLTLELTLFRQLFRNFQLNTYTGTNFIVSNVVGCRTSLGTTDSDAIAGNSACADPTAGVLSKGVEIEGSLRPAQDVTLAAGFTYADTRYRKDIAGSPDALTGNNSLPTVLFLLPGSRLSNAPAYTATGSVSWTPRLTDRLRALIYADARWQSRFNTGSDLLPEKEQAAFATINARIGLTSGRWTVELWAQNLFDTRYKQVVFSEPLQGGGSGGLPGTSAAVTAFGTSSTQVFGAFLGEPRTWGATLRWQF